MLSKALLTQARCVSPFMNSRAQSFVVCGEALLDVFVAHDTRAGVQLDAKMGGSPFNVAIGLARLGQAVAFFGAVSTDTLGERLMRALRDEQVAAEAVVRTPMGTTLGLVSLDENGVPSYCFHGTSDRQLTLDALQRIPTGARVFHVGSYATVVEPSASTLRALIEAERARSLIAYDPNVRLAVQPSLDCWRDTLQWMISRDHLLKISEEDVALLYPGTPIEPLAAEWLSHGVQLVIVTRGAAGARAWTAQRRIQIPSVEIALADTVGAGDSFQAAFLTWLAEHEQLSRRALAKISSTDLTAALHFAAQAAAITCSRQGADLPRRPELPAMAQA
jgi:fructokinase